MTSFVKHAFRVLLKNPGFTLIAIFSMAIGIGATSAMFSFADALLLRPLPVKDPSSVVAISAAGSAFAGDPSISYPDYSTSATAPAAFKVSSPPGMRNLVSAPRLKRCRA